MAEEVGIVMSLYDKVSDTLKAIGGNTKAFSKDMDQLEESAKTYDTVQKKLVDNVSDLKSKLAASSKTVKDATDSWKKHGDAMSEKAMKEAIDDQVKWQQELKDSEEALKTNRKAFLGYCEDIRKNENRMSSGDGSGGADILSKLGKAGLMGMAGDTLSGVANAFVGSAFGSDAGTMFSSTLSGAASGAAMGSLLGPLGTAIGGAVGGALGAINGATQVFEREDDAFKSYAQEQYSAVQQNRAAELEGGVGIAGGREQTRMAFNTLLGGEDVAADYLDQVRSMAARTNYTYDEIAGYTKSLLAAFPADEIMDMLGKLSDTTAGLSLSTSDVDMMISSLSRMKLVGKANQEYLKIFTERGINSYQAIADYRTANGKTTKTEDVAGLISKGKITGQEAVDALLSYMGGTFAGLSDDLAGSYMGLVDNLGDVQDDLNDAIGVAYNNERKGSIQADLDTYGDGDTGIAMREANAMIGTSKAFAENMSEEYMRQVMGAVFTGSQATLENLDNEALQKMHEQYEEYKADFDNGDKEAGLEIEKLKSSAENMAQEAYKVSDVGMAVHDSEMGLLEALQDNTNAIKAWKLGYEFTQKADEGQVASTLRNNIGTGILPTVGASTYLTGGSITAAPGRASGYLMPRAIGLDRVPYDGYPALLHEGERVLTAREARQQDGSGGVAPIQIDVHDNSFSGTMEQQAEQIMRIVAPKLIAARAVQAPK